MKCLTFFIAFYFLISSEVAVAQINAPESSPTCRIEQKVGLTDVSIVYSRPSMKDRIVFGGLVAYGELWRTGANASTKIAFTDNVRIKGETLPKGTYALYSIPNEKEWEIIIHSNTTHWGTGGKNYNEEEDVIRFKVKPSQTPIEIETFTIQLGNVSNNGAEIQIMWGNTVVRFPFTVDTDNKVMADIKQKLSGPSPTTYYQAAKYYYEASKDLDLALDWIKAAQKSGDKFWMMRLQALIEAKMGNYKNAIKAANKSINLAKAANNVDYVRLNEQSIKEWKKAK